MLSFLSRICLFLSVNIDNMVLYVQKNFYIQFFELILFTPSLAVSHEKYHGW